MNHPPLHTVIVGPVLPLAAVITTACLAARLLLAIPVADPDAGAATPSVGSAAVPVVITPPHPLAPVTRLADGVFLVDRSRVHLDGVRVVPRICCEGSSSCGSVKIYAVKPGSLAATLGLANGDALVTVNGGSLLEMDPDWAYQVPALPALSFVVERGAHRRFTLQLLLYGTSGAGPAALADAGAALGDPDPLASAAIHRVADHTFALDAGTLWRFIAGLDSATPRAMKLVWTAPTARGQGLRLYGVQDGSLITALGLRSGDIVTAVNGIPMGGGCCALGSGVERVLLHPRTLRVAVTRDRQRFTIVFRIAAAR